MVLLGGMTLYMFVLPERRTHVERKATLRVYSRRVQFTLK